MNSVLIISSDGDPHAQAVAEKLRRRDATVALFDQAQFPRDACLSFRCGGGRATRTIRVGERTLDVDAFTAAWHRRPGAPTPHDHVTDPRVRDYVVDEARTFLLDFWNSLTCFKVPGPQPVYRRAELKASQLALAVELGFEVPPTLVTTDPTELADFYRQHEGRIISKLPGPTFYKDHFGNDFMRYTERVRHRDLGYLAAARLSPMIYQAYVPKRLELRITVVGQRIFAAEIHSQGSNHARNDWRRYDISSTPHAEHALPERERALCLALVARLGLCYGTIDLVVTPDGRYVFLEINPNGQYLWIEHLTGMPIGDAVCDLLLSGGRDSHV